MSEAQQQGERVQALMRARHNMDTATLREALLDPDHRGLAARYLGELGAVDAAGDIARLLDTRSTGTRVAAVKALAVLRAHDFRTRIRELAEEDSDSQVQLWSIAALGELGMIDDLPYLISLLNADDWDTRRAAAYALGLSGHAEAIESLTQASKRERRTRRYVYKEALTRLRAASPE